MMFQVPKCHLRIDLRERRRRQLENCRQQRSEGAKERRKEGGILYLYALLRNSTTARAQEVQTILEGDVGHLSQRYGGIYLFPLKYL